MACSQTPTNDSAGPVTLATDEEVQGPLEPHWVDNSRYYVSDVVGSVADSVDSYIADDHREVDNASYLRLRVGQTWQEGGHFITKSDIRFKADFPRTKDTVGIVFDTSPEEFESLEQQNRESGTGDQSIRDSDTATAALRFSLGGAEHWSPNLDVGIKGGLPINPFLRFQFGRRFFLPARWGLISKNALYYYYQDGGAVQSSLSFIRPMANDLVFINKQDVRWVHDQRLLTFGNISSLTRVVDDRIMLTYRAGGFYEQMPDPHVTSYFIDFSCRLRLHEDWLYAELIPSMTWPEEKNFDEIAEFTLRFELFFKN
ncbi:MAG: hypothetical protein HRU20_07005 [Pseudomonadales bacterium]|nr:hypothetical protein [Pseudomonadales bacterium]